MKRIPLVDPLCPPSLPKEKDAVWSRETDVYKAQIRESFLGHWMQNVFDGQISTFLHPKSTTTSKIGRIPSLARSSCSLLRLSDQKVAMPGDFNLPFVLNFSPRPCTMPSTWNNHEASPLRNIDELCCWAPNPKPQTLPKGSYAVPVWVVQTPDK